MLKATKNWLPQQKMIIPSLLSVVLSDEVFENNPEYNEDQFQSAESTFLQYI